MRADVFLTAGGYVQSRRRAQELIEGGHVTVDGKLLKKASTPIDEGAHTVEVCDPQIYVGRGGQKLEGALDAFAVDVHGKRAIDIGASTGGFTDCLLQRGAVAVVAVDAGRDQLAPSLRADARVRNVEACNARYLTADTVGGRAELIVMDVSFISATYILPRFPLLLSEGGEAICLVKPQFEVGPERIGKGGIVKDRASHRLALERVTSAAQSVGLSVRGIIPSPIVGGDGNREFLLYMTLGKAADALLGESLVKSISSALEAMPARGGCAE